jgi:hypothetical protein
MPTSIRRVRAFASDRGIGNGARPPLHLQICLPESCQPVENGTTGIKNFAFTLFSSSFKLAIPPPEVLKAFNSMTSNLFGRQQILAAEVETLATLRDTLLPNSYLASFASPTPVVLSEHGVDSAATLG